MHRIPALLLLVGVASAEMTSGGNGGAPAPGPDPAAPAGGQGAPAPAPGFDLIWIIFLGFLVLMIWSTFRNQRKEQRKRQELVANLKIGDRVTTIGGVQGEVVRKGEQNVDVRTGGPDGPVITFTLGAVNQVNGDGASDAKR